MALTTLEGARKELATLIQKYKRDQIPDAKARTLGYLYAHLLSFFKTEQDGEILKRIEALEEQQNKGGLCTRVTK